ncbi:MAG: hypothetical protein BWY67_02154 [Bacteroidetes bacterium ADurb.Bin397]|nr:MAG: hypothetical protein BWY67_02154 [Bacteroidetes bacterium ADurb.Bin397]
MNARLHAAPLGPVLTFPTTVTMLLAESSTTEVISANPIVPSSHGRLKRFTQLTAPLPVCFSRKACDVPCKLLYPTE